MTPSPHDPPQVIYALFDTSLKRVRPMQGLALGISRSGTESLCNALSQSGYSDVYHGFRFILNGHQSLQWLRLPSQRPIVRVPKRCLQTAATKINGWFQEASCCAWHTRRGPISLSVIYIRREPHGHKSALLQRISFHTQLHETPLRRISMWLLSPLCMWRMNQ